MQFVYTKTIPIWKKFKIDEEFWDILNELIAALWRSCYCSIEQNLVYHTCWVLSSSTWNNVFAVRALTQIVRGKMKIERDLFLFCIDRFLIEFKLQSKLHLRNLQADIRFSSRSSFIYDNNFASFGKKIIFYES